MILINHSFGTPSFYMFGSVMTPAFRSAASSSLWEEKTSVLPPRNSRTMAAAVCFVPASSPVNGSSMMRMSDGARSARRSAVRRFMPPENSETGFFRDSSGRSLEAAAESSDGE